MSWRGEEGGIKAVKAGNQAIMTPGKYCYLSLIHISAVDIKGAQRNVETEIPSWDFDSIMTATQNKWNDYLKTIQVEGNNETQKQIFYTERA